MKQKMFGFAGLALAFVVLGLAGCSSTAKTVVYDSSVPVPEQVSLIIAGGVHVRQFDGENVGPGPFMGETALAGWGLDGTAANFHGSAGSATVIIPPGPHTLLVSFYMGNGEQSAWVRDVEVSRDFAPGHSYRLAATLHYGEGLFGAPAYSTDEYSMMSMSYSGLESAEFTITDLGVTPAL